MGIGLPKGFLNITFLPAGKEYDSGFLEDRYRIIGEDDVGSLIGAAADGVIYLLDPAAEKGRELVYLAKDRKTLAAAVRTYRRHRRGAMAEAALHALLRRGVDNEDKLARKEAASLKKKLSALDPAMFRDEFTFWSPLLEEIEWGMI